MNIMDTKKKNQYNCFKFKPLKKSKLLKPTNENVDIDIPCSWTRRHNMKRCQLFPR